MPWETSGLLELYRTEEAPRQWRWRYRAFNGQIVAASTESYRGRRDVIANIAGTLGIDLARPFHDLRLKRGRNFGFRIKTVQAFEGWQVVTRRTVVSCATI